MNCPICDSKLKEAHIAARHYSLECICNQGLSIYYSIFYEFIAKKDQFEVSNETFNYSDIKIQKIYYKGHRYPDFYWSVRYEVKYNFGPREVRANLILDNQEFILKFKYFDPQNICNIRERFELLETFS